MYVPQWETTRADHIVMSYATRHATIASTNITNTPHVKIPQQQQKHKHKAKFCRMQSGVTMGSAQPKQIDAALKPASNLPEVGAKCNLAH